MKRVLVTGASGFIGRKALGPLKERGYEVHAADLHSRETLPGEAGVVWHTLDLMDAAQTARLVADVAPTHLLHFAWYAAPGQFWNAPDNFAFVRASLSLLEAFAAYGGQRFVGAGTCAEYDWRHGFCSEGVTPLAPGTPYGVCKRALGEMLGAHARISNYSAAWGRVFWLYGPHEHPARLVASVAKALANGEPAECTHGRQVRDFLHVADVGAAFAALLDSVAEGAVNIASGQPVTLREIVETLGDQAGRLELVRLGARPASADEPPLVVADVRRLQDEVGFMPCYSLRDGLTETLNWWQKQLADGRKGQA